MSVEDQQTPTIETVARIYAGTRPKSQLRYLVVALYAGYANECWDIPKDTCPEFLHDIVSFVFEQRTEPRPAMCLAGVKASLREQIRTGRRRQGPTA